jgi:hypothetical protein
MLWKSTVFKLFLKLIIIDVVLILASHEDHQIIMTIWCLLVDAVLHLLNMTNR